MTDLAPALKGAIWMVLASVFWSAMYLIVRGYLGGFTAFEILFMRNVVTVALMAPLIFHSGLGALATRRLPMHCLRALFAYAAMLGIYYGIAHAVLADVVSLSFTQPLFIVVLAALLLGERVAPRRWVATLVGFSGILVIVRPGFAEVSLATLVVLGSAALYGASNICIKSLMRTDTPTQSVFYGNALMLPLSLAPALLTWTRPGWDDLFWMTGVGVSGALGVYCVSQAYSAADASAVVPYEFLRLPITAAGAWLLFGEVAGMWTWAGALVIFCGAYALVLLEARAARAAG